MFLKSKKNTTSRHTLGLTYRSGDILPVMSAEELLAASRHQALIDQLRSMSGLPEEHFIALYEGVVNNFAEFVQTLPIQINSPLCGLLNQGIARARIALKNFVLDQGKKVDSLQNYAVFTAALLRDINKAVINYKVVLVDEKGMFVDDWRPLESSMVDRGKFYKIYPTAPAYQRLERQLLPLLARQVLPELGFLWIASDPKIFAEWLDALCGDDSQGGRITRALTLIKHDDVITLENSLPQAEFEVIHSDENQYGEAFLSWLRNAIENGNVKVNSHDAMVHIVDEGVFVERQLFKQFSDLMKVPVNMNVVFTQFGNLFGIAKKGGYDYLFDNNFSHYANILPANHSSFSGSLVNRQRSLREGMVIADVGVIFAKANPPEVNAKLKSTTANNSSQARQIPGTANQTKTANNKLS